MIWAAPAITNHNQLVTDNQILLRGIQANTQAHSGDVLTPKYHSRFINATHVHTNYSHTDGAGRSGLLPWPWYPIKLYLDF